MPNGDKKQAQLNLYIKFLKERVFFAPHSATLHYNLALAYLQKGDLAEAIEFAKRAIELNPGWLQPLNTLAVACLQAGQIEDSIAASRKMIGTDDSYAPAHYQLGVALRMAGQADEGKEHLAKAKELGYPVTEEMEAGWSD